MASSILLRCKSIIFQSSKTDYSNLTPEEFQKLREYPLCPSRSDKKMMVVNQMYEPNRDLEKLELPIISWPIDVFSQSNISDSRVGVRSPQKQDSYTRLV